MICSPNLGIKKPPYWYFANFGRHLQPEYIQKPCFTPNSQFELIPMSWHVFNNIKEICVGSIHCRFRKNDMRSGALCVKGVQVQIGVGWGSGPS